ncbi:YchJ family protein [Mycobacterium sp. CBMA293]|uniref:YchJ family protein n=2 Tax=Mycolicibacterium TaxID=1866885 RepID=UPI001325842D|nr:MULTISPECIES: YchJ family protein [unclassified Mycolicibacterium]MUL46889.1 YchJ family protein [Mycolicibacterium sp. CBMA 360]MUL92413.1 YchJ family protein [Mycolicibacterium sp. CBMA 230]MUL57325.1 YchJ family protein [Mycolicibacterium sp. CBMA 335]MUL70365.1 YchJ family protein [Mycolicibacterium sp. CBMA 311]MUM12504.1 YchJ family protein [Mycolicibacterium sp. CBMA 293]
MPTNNQPCRCDSGMEYADCCGPLHRGERPAATAVALMRSRFTAFALGDVAYLLATWHQSTRPARLDLDDGVVWRRLQIVDTESGGADDPTGMVQFRAQYVQDGGRHILHERSRFTRDRGGRWLYVDGDFVD